MSGVEGPPESPGTPRWRWGKAVRRTSPALEMWERELWSLIARRRAEALAAGAAEAELATSATLSLLSRRDCEEIDRAVRGRLGRYTARTESALRSEPDRYQDGDTDV